MGRLFGNSTISATFCKYKNYCKVKERGYFFKTLVWVESLLPGPSRVWHSAPRAPVAPKPGGSLRAWAELQDFPDRGPDTPPHPPTGFQQRVQVPRTPCCLQVWWSFGLHFPTEASALVSSWEGGHGKEWGGWRPFWQWKEKNPGARIDQKEDLRGLLSQF